MQTTAHSGSARPRDTETGAIAMDARLERKVRAVLRERANRWNAAARHALGVLGRGLGTARDDLDAFADRLAAEQQRWDSSEHPEAMLMVHRVAMRAAAEHLDSCRAGSGRMRAVPKQALDKVLPRRTLAENFFPVADVHGDVPAGITLWEGQLVWSAGATAHEPASAARSAPLAAAAFELLEQAAFPPGLGGDIVDGHGNVVVSYG